MSRIINHLNKIRTSYSIRLSSHKVVRSGFLWRRSTLVDLGTYWFKSGPTYVERSNTLTKNRSKAHQYGTYPEALQDLEKEYQMRELLDVAALEHLYFGIFKRIDWITRDGFVIKRRSWLSTIVEKFEIYP